MKKHRAMIYRTQPCYGLRESVTPQARLRRKRHQLADLENLWNHDKHRMLQPVSVVPMQADGTFTQFDDCEVIGNAWMNPKFLGRPLKRETEVFGMRIRRTGPKPYVHMDCQFACDIAFANGLPAEKALSDIGEWVEALIAWFMPEFETPRARRLWGQPRGGWIERSPLRMKATFYQRASAESEPVWSQPVFSERLS
jgi:hypothetical protein